MDSNEYNKVIAFDTLFTTNHIQMLKVMLPYMDNKAQKSLAVYIKFMELRYTIDFCSQHPYSPCMNPEESFDLGKICDELFPYCTEKERNQMEQLRNMVRSMEMYREISQTMELMKDIMPDMDATFADAAAASGAGGGNPDMLQTIMSMLSPEQMEIFNLFGGNNHDQ